MAELVRNSLADSRVRDQAIELVRMMTITNYTEFARAVSDWVRDHYQTIGEPDETLIPPAEQIEKIDRNGTVYADCDDAAMLVAALCCAVGLPARFRAVFPLADGGFSHVFVETDVGVGEGKWLALDPTIDGYPAWAGESFLLEV